MPGRLGAGEAKEFGEEKGERGSREEGKRAPGYFQKFQTLVKIVNSHACLILNRRGRGWSC